MSSLTWKRNIFKNIFVTLLLMLDTAPVQPGSFLIEVSVTISREPFRVTAGLHEAETLFLQTEYFWNQNLWFRWKAILWPSHLDIAFLPPAFPPSDKRRRCFLGGCCPCVPPPCVPPTCVPPPCVPPPTLWRRQGEDPGEKVGSLQEVPTNMISKLSPCYLDAFTHTWKTSTACRRERGGRVKTHL